jgi:hypothetical protein
MKTSSSIVFFIFAVLIVVVFSATTELHSVPLPRKSQPLRVTNILLDVGHTAAQSSSQNNSILQTTGFSQIHSLSQNDVSYFSSTSLAEDSPELYPFGKNMYFAFQTQTAESFEMLTTQQDGLLSSTILNEFHLIIDDSPIYSSSDRSTTFSTLVNDQTDEKKQIFSKHTSFKGTRMNELNQQETLFITITPTGGNYLQSNPGEKNKLETLSATSSFTPQSGRVADQYTIEGYLISGDKHYHIAPFSTLQYQVQVELDNTKIQAQVALEQFDEQSLTKMTEQMDIMSDIITQLSEQRNEASYDLAIVEMEMEGLPGACGNNHDHSHEETSNTDHSDDDDNNNNNNNHAEAVTIDPLALSPSYYLRRWTADCNPYIGRIVIFPLRIFASWSYQTHASASTTVSAVAVEARTKLLLQLINQVTQEQLGFIWKLADIVSGGSSDSRGWNARDVSDSKCTLQNSTVLNAVGTERLKEQYRDTAALHALVSCASSGVVGIASVNVLCSKTAANGVSGINFIASWTTFAHELQHQVGMEHPFKTDSQIGTFGGLADYYNIRLPPTDPNPARYGFNQKTDSEKTCAGLRNALTSRSAALVSGSNCYTMNARTVLADFCGNGMVEPWEECDASNACCNNCKLAAGATCGSGNAECCVNCHTQGAKRCSLPTDTTIKTGICSAGGICVLSNCAEAVPGWQGDSCPSEFFFPTSLSDKCSYACPTDSTCSQPVYSSRTNFETGAACFTKAGTAGICVESEPFNTKTAANTARCVTDISYSWKYTVVSQCDCAASLDLIDVYTCVNTAGGVVSSSYCDLLEKPARDTCCCSPPCAQDSETRGGSSASFASYFAVVFIAIFTIFFV